MGVIKRCITVTDKQDKKILNIQMKRMKKQSKTISYSSVIQDAITEGLKRIR